MPKHLLHGHIIGVRRKGRKARSKKKCWKQMVTGSGEGYGKIGGKNLGMKTTGKVLWRRQRLTKCFSGSKEEQESLYSLPSSIIIFKTLQFSLIKNTN